MNLGELRAEYRTRTDDVVGPEYLWVDSEIDRYANDAVNEACERAYLIEDDVTPAVCDIAVTANTATYLLHTSIIKVREVSWNGRYLTGRSREQLSDCYRHGWRTLTGTPQSFVDPQEKYLTLVPGPKINGTVHLLVYRRPLVPMEDEADEPEIHERFHLQLLDWMTHLGYLKLERETNDPALAAEREAAFIRSFGPRPDADTRRTQRARRTNQVRMNPDW